MRAATGPRDGAAHERLLVVDTEAGFTRELDFSAFGDLLASGDVLVLNDAATLPASLRVSPELELRLLGMDDSGTWLAVTLGAGDHRIDTDHRGAPPKLELGQHLDIQGHLTAHVVGFDSLSDRLTKLRFEPGRERFWQALYRCGRPIQYSHVTEALELWDVQNRYASDPWAVEPPSAGRALRIQQLLGLRRRGIEVVTLTHAAGVSATGVPAIDASLPLPERYRIPERTVRTIQRARADGGRIVAVGTSVVRALESNHAEHRRLRTGTGIARLRLGPGFPLAVVDGLLTGLHAPGTSHYALLHAFAPEPLLRESFDWAEQRGFSQHEFGDAALWLPCCLIGQRAA